MRSGESVVRGGYWWEDDGGGVGRVVEGWGMLGGGEERWVVVKSVGWW